MSYSLDNLETAAREEGLTQLVLALGHGEDTFMQLLVSPTADFSGDVEAHCLKTGDRLLLPGSMADWSIVS